MKIDKIELFLCRLPLVHFFETSFGRSYDRTFVLIRVEGEGEEGWGESVAEANPYYSSETTETVWHIIAGFIAPLIVGTLFVAYVAGYHLQMRVLWDTFRNGQFDLFWLGVRALPRAQDFYLWFYLAIAVSSTMMPSESDRHAWLELLISVVVLFAIALLFGAGPWMLSIVAPRLSSFLSSVAAIFGLSAFVHLLLILPTALIHKLVARATGVDVA